MKIIEDLINMGLSYVEARIYYTLLKKGNLTVLDISKLTNLKRTTVHINIETLKKMGLVSEIIEGARRKIIAEKPDNIRKFIDVKKTEINKLEKNFPTLLKKLNLLSVNSPNNNKFRVKFYEGKAGVRTIYKDVLRSDELYSYVNIERIFRTFPENPSLFPKAADLGKFKVWKEIIEDSKYSRRYIDEMDAKINYQYKFFPNHWNMTLFDYMIYENKVAIVSEDEFINGILIESENIYKNAKVLFEMMWELLPKAKSDFDYIK